MFTSIRSKLLTLLSSLLIFSVLASLAVTNWIVADSQRNNVRAALERTEQVVDTLLEAQQANLINQVQLVAILPILATVVEDGDEATILDSSKAYQEQLSLDIFDVLDEDGEFLVSVNDNFPEDEPLQYSYLISQALDDGKTNVSLIFRAGRLALVSAAPIGLPDEPSGVLMVGQFLDDEFAKEVEALTGATLSFYVENQIITSSLENSERANLTQQINQNYQPKDNATIIDLESHLVKIKPMDDIHGTRLASIIIQISLREANEILWNIRFLLVSVGVLVFCIAIIVGIFFTVRTLIRPIQKLQNEAKELAQGNLQLAIDTSREDELGSLAKSFAEMRDAIRHKIEDLSKLNGTGALLAGMFEQTEALETVLKVLQEKTRIEKGSVYLLDDQDTLQIKAFYPAHMPPSGGKPKSFQLGEGIIGKSAQNKKIIYIPDSSENTDFIDQGNEDSKALLCIPLLDGDKLHGILNFSGAANSIKFDESDREFAQTLANMTVVTTKNIKMVNVIEEYSRTLEDKVEERTAAIKDLLDNTGQGFFSFRKDYQISPEYSQACVAFFGKPIDRLNAMDLMFGSSDPGQKEAFISDEENLPALKQKGPHPDSVRELLDMVFEDLGDMAVLGDLLPSEISVGDLILDVSFNLIETEQHDKRFMVVLTDVTVERQLAEQISAEEVFNTMIIKVALDREGFIQFLNEIEKLFFSIYRLLAQSLDHIDHHELFRYFHTIKGGAASYSLKVVSAKAHEIEEGLEEVRSGETKLTNELISHLVIETFKLQKVLIQSLDKLSSIISDEDRKQTEKIYKIRDSKITKIKDYLLDKLAPNAIDPVHFAIDQLRRQPIGPILNKYAMTAEGLADQLNKPLNIQIKGNNVEVSHEQLESFFGSLVHLVRNCVDHGLEKQDVRKMLGKTEKGTITIEALMKGSSLIIKIADDGGGIDAEVIKNIALKKGIIDNDYASSASEDELVKLIFVPGFSTKEEASDISGRGVGMDAVKATVNDLQGDILIKTDLDLGTTFQITIPHVI